MYTLFLAFWSDEKVFAKLRVGFNISAICKKTKKGRSKHNEIRAKYHYQKRRRSDWRNGRSQTINKQISYHPSKNIHEATLSVHLIPAWLATELIVIHRCWWHQVIINWSQWCLPSLSDDLWTELTSYSMTLSLDGWHQRFVPSICGVQ